MNRNESVVQLKIDLSGFGKKLSGFNSLNAEIVKLLQQKSWSTNNATMSPTDAVSLIISGLYVILNAVLLPIIIAVLHRTIIEYKKVKPNQDKPSVLLYNICIAFNVVTFASVFGLMFMAIFKI